MKATRSPLRSQTGMNLRRASLTVLALLLGLAAAPTARADELDVLLQEWEIVSRRVDERGWAEQQALLDRIAELDTPESRKALAKLRDRDPRSDWRRTKLILGALLRHGTPDDVDDAIRWVETRRDPYLLEGLADVLAGVQAPEARAHLRGKALDKAPPPVKAQIARGLGLAKDRASIPSLLRLLDEKDVRVRVEALDALGALEDAMALSPVLVFLKDKDPRVRDAAARALGAFHEKRAIPPLLEMLEDEDPRVVESAALSLGRLGDPSAVPALVELLKKVLATDLRVADAVATALEQISGKPIGLDCERWCDWWDAVKDKPWVVPEASVEPVEGRTVPAHWYYGLPIRSSRLVFVLDISRSMGWNERLDTAKKELVSVLEKLPEATRFNIVVFSDSANGWKPELQPATRANKNKAKKFVERLSAQNGTNTWDALQVTFKDQDVDTIMLLSDGHPSVGAFVEPDQILAELDMANRYRRVRIHVVALLRGDPPTGYAGREDARRAEAFMRALASGNAGDFQRID